MNIVFLTTDEPIYLPAFFDRVLNHYAGQTCAVYAVPPLYKNQTTFKAIKRYYKTFGFGGVIGLSRRVLLAKLRNQSIETVCKKHKVTYDLVQDVNNETFLEQLRGMGTDLIISVSCPQIFKKPLIGLPSRGILNIHGAILPQYRGIMPSFWMLANGEKQAGVTIYFVNEEIDAGDYVGQEIFDILPDDTLDSFIRRSKQIAASLLLEVLARVENNTATATPLNTDEGSYYSWPTVEAVQRFRAQGRKLW